MTLQNLIDEARDKLDDAIQPYLWSDAELVRYANNAVNRLCKEALLIVDSITVAICSVAVLALTQNYAKDDRIVHVREATITPRATPLVKRNLDWLSHHWPTWRSAQAGTPIFFAEDIDEGKITLIPKPVANDTLSLTVYRFPLTQFADTSAGRAVSPEFHWEFHPHIHAGILAQAYGKQDSECFDRQMMERYEALFNRNVDKAKLDIYKKRYQSQTVGVHWGNI